MILDDLNPEQRSAVTHGDGPLLILAGAGSGKTRVITSRIAWLVESGADPRSILAVTFTNKAAGEMRERVRKLLGHAGMDVWISTFHSAGVRILREHGHHLGLPPNLIIYDDADQRALLKRVIRELGFDDKVLTPRKVLSRISTEKGRGVGPDDMEVDRLDFTGERIQSVYAHYQRALRAAGAVDFGDLLMETVRLFDEVPAVLQSFQERFAHVMVDEFQDTNAVQYDLIRHLIGARGNLVVVGDDDQAIYRWRGADIRNILSFERDFPTTTVVRLERNYRSTQRILDAAHAVIRHVPNRKEKKLWTDAPAGDPIEVFQTPDEQDEARLVASTVDRLSENYPLSEIAVFYRVNAQSRVLEDALRGARIPYLIVRGRSFYDRAEIRDLTAYLRLAVNPASDADFLRVVNTPRRGIGKTTLTRLQAFASGREGSLFAAVQSGEVIPGLTKAPTAKLRAFAGLVAGLNDLVEKDAPPQDIVEAALRDSGYSDALGTDGSPEAAERLENLNEMVSAATQRADEGKSLLDFLDEMALTADADTRAPDDGQRVNLMTLHAAKGLEFDAVIITGMEERTFPHARAFLDEGYAEDLEEMSEERRLCYVGFTRARKSLLLSCCHTRFLMGRRQVRTPSRFIRDIPKDLVVSHLIERTPRYQDEYVVRRGREIPWRMNRLDEPIADEPALGEEDGIVVDYEFDQRPVSERGDRTPRRGRRVNHRTFGEGVIHHIEGTGPAARLVIRFETVGTKKILARYVELL